MDKFRKISINTAVVMGTCFYALAILLHIFVLTGILPYTWVNGGHSESLSAQIPLSIFNIIVSLVGIFFTLIAGGYLPFKFNRGNTLIAWFFVVYWSIGFVQQILGTPFEKYGLSPLLLLGVISNLRIAIEYKTKKV